MTVARATSTKAESGYRPPDRTTLLESLRAAADLKDQVGFDLLMDRMDDDVLRSVAALNRLVLSQQLDDEVIRDNRANRVNQVYWPEVVIGSGISAAIYCAAKAAAEGATPLVLEEREVLGGVFALARRPVFYLNSRNRPDIESTRKGPGTRYPLNAVPGGVLQPADVNSQEYQSQDVLSLVAKANIVMNARVRTSVSVDAIEIGDFHAYTIRFANGYALSTDRVIIATGLGEDDVTFEAHLRTGLIQTFTDFVLDVGNPSTRFPLSGLDRVAVVGANDSGNVVIEYLCGQGPRTANSVPSLDEVKAITWVGQDCLTKEDFEKGRSRYAGIGRFMPRKDQPDYPAKIMPIPGRAISVKEFGGRAKLRWKGGGDGPYFSDVFDRVIVCTGFADTNRELLADFQAVETILGLEGTDACRVLAGEQIYKIGPCANLPVTERERTENPALREIPENSAALFRYTERIGAVARFIAGLEKEEPAREV